MEQAKRSSGSSGRKTRRHKTFRFMNTSRRSSGGSCEVRFEAGRPLADVRVDLRHKEICGIIELAIGRDKFTERRR